MVMVNFTYYKCFYEFKVNHGGEGNGQYNSPTFFSFVHKQYRKSGSVKLDTCKGLLCPYRLKV